MMVRHPLLAVAMALLVLVGSVGLAPATQAPPAPRQPALTAAQAEITKATLSETSIDGPSLWTSPNGTVRGVLAWTGTDPGHHISVMTTAIGTKFANWLALPETSPTRPAVARLTNGKVAVAWIGTDPAHTLNVLLDVYGSRTKLTLWGETSASAPALVAKGTDLVLAWTGTNSGRSLNVLPLTTSTTITPGTKTTLWSFSALGGPSLNYEASRSEYVLAWDAKSPANRLAVSKSSTLTSWGTPTVLADWSYATPSILGITGNYYGMPPHYLAWTGGDAARSLNVEYTRSFPTFPASTTTKVTLAESALNAPALGFISGPGLMLLSWTGTDPAHRINVAVITMLAPAPCSLPGITPETARVVSSGPSDAKAVALTFDAGGAEGNPGSLLTTLENAKVPATFFLTAEWVQAHQALAQRMKDDGFAIGNHSVDHPDLVTPARSDSYICYQLGLANQIIADRAGISGTRPYFRPPYGSYNTQVVKDAAAIGYVTITWSIDTIDWKDTSTATDILNRVKAQLGPGKIILMHVGSLHEPEALPSVIQYIESQGYSIVPLNHFVS